LSKPMSAWRAQIGFRERTQGRAERPDESGRGRHECLRYDLRGVVFCMFPEISSEKETS
jgi:hypothetical protein